MEAASEPALEPGPTSSFKHQDTHLSLQIQGEGLTSARYSTQNFRSSEEPLREQKVRLALELVTESQLFAAQPAVSPRGLCVVLPVKRRRKGQGNLWRKAHLISN